jgi:hypothetical protein
LAVDSFRQFDQKPHAGSHVLLVRLAADPAMASFRPLRIYDYQEGFLMGRNLSFLTMLLLTVTIGGCGGAPETDEAASEAAAELENSPDYQQQMMGGGATTE